MQFLAEGFLGQLDQPAEQPYDLVDSLIVTGQLVSARAVPHDIRREVLVPQGVEVAFREGLEAVAKLLLVGVCHAEPPFEVIPAHDSGARGASSANRLSDHTGEGWRSGGFMRAQYLAPRVRITVLLRTVFLPGREDVIVGQGSQMFLDRPGQDADGQRSALRCDNERAEDSS